MHIKQKQGRSQNQTNKHGSCNSRKSDCEQDAVKSSKMFEFCGVTSVLASAIICIVLHIIYKLIIKNWNYFVNRNVIYERGIPVIGTFMGNFKTLLGKKSIFESIQDIYDRHSNRKLIGIYDIGGSPSYFIRDIDLIHKITIKDFDTFMNHSFQIDRELDPLMSRVLFTMKNQSWRDMRSTLSPIFTGSKMRHMLSLMINCTNELTAHIRNDILSKSKGHSHEYNVMDLMMCLTNDIIGSTVFGIQINTLKNPANEFYHMGKEIAYALPSLRTFVLICFPKLASLLKLKVLTDRHSNFFRNVINNTVELRKREKIVRNDMFNLLLLIKEGKLNDEKDLESDQDAGFATISEFMSAKTSEKLKSKSSL